MNNLLQQIYSTGTTPAVAAAKKWLNNNQSRLQAVPTKTIKRKTMAITLTQTAANRVEKFLANRGKGIGLRLGVKTTGCSGMAYTLEFVDDMQPEDTSFDSHGVKVIVDPKSLAYIDGTELDFTKEGLNEGFKFNNPNVKDECGCGESFTV